MADRYGRRAPRALFAEKIASKLAFPSDCTQPIHYKLLIFPHFQTPVGLSYALFTYSGYFVIIPR